MSKIFDRLSNPHDPLITAKKIGAGMLAASGLFFAAGCNDPSSARPSLSPTAEMIEVEIGDTMYGVIQDKCNTSNDRKILDAIVFLSEYNGNVNPSFTDSRTSLNAGESLYFPVNFCSKTINDKIPDIDPQTLRRFLIL